MVEEEEEEKGEERGGGGNYAWKHPGCYRIALIFRGSLILRIS